MVLPPAEMVAGPRASGADESVPLLGPRYGFTGKAQYGLDAPQAEALVAVKDKLERGFYRVEHTPCALCGGADLLPLASQDRYGLRLRVVVCRTCGLVQVSPRMSQGAYWDFYSNHYRCLYRNTAGDASQEGVFQDELVRGRLVVEFLRRQGVLGTLPRNGLVVEYGCGSGGLLKAFAEEGFECLGADVDRDCVDFGVRNHGLDLRRATMESFSPDREPALVLCSHILEHMLDPVGFLSRVGRAMGSASLLYIEVPGVRWLHRTNLDFLATLQNAHVFYFTLRSLSCIAGRSGFVRLHGDERIRSVWRRSRSGELAETVPDSARRLLRYLKCVEVCRRIMPVHPATLRRAVRGLITAAGGGR